MNMMVPTRMPAHWGEALSRLGFSGAADGSYHCHGTRFKITGQWATLESDGAYPLTDPLNITPQQPALWKWIDAGCGHRHVFELPTTVLTHEHFDETAEAEQTPAFASCLAWALETVKPQVTEKWQPPSRQQIEAWIPQGKLTVQSGDFVRQGELIVDTARLVVRFPILPMLPPDLPELRLRWLEEFLRDAQTCWRMIRFGITRDASAASVIAELDLTGAPHHLIEPLLLTGLDGLRWAVLALVETAELLADTTIRSQALAVSPITPPTQPKEQP